jgi:hypothetical protein
MTQKSFNLVKNEDDKYMFNDGQFYPSIFIFEIELGANYKPLITK